MPEQEPKKFGWAWEAIELLALIGVGLGSGVLVGVFAGVWAGVGTGVLAVSAIALGVCLRARTKIPARDGVKPGAEG